MNEVGAIILRELVTESAIERCRRQVVQETRAIAVRLAELAAGKLGLNYALEGLELAASACVELADDAALVLDDCGYWADEEE